MRSKFRKCHTHTERRVYFNRHVCVCVRVHGAASVHGAAYVRVRVCVWLMKCASTFMRNDDLLFKYVAMTNSAKIIDSLQSHHACTHNDEPDDSHCDIFQILRSVYMRK